MLRDLKTNMVIHKMVQEDGFKLSAYYSKNNNCSNFSLRIRYIECDSSGEKATEHCNAGKNRKDESKRRRRA